MTLADPPREVEFSTFFKKNFEPFPKVIIKIA